MNSKVNYTLVGIFVLFAIGLILVFVTWLMEPTNKKAVQLYKINFSESVSGLNIDSPVKYRGVTIGNVKEMRINPDNIEVIEVLISVDDAAPIKIDTVAKLKAQGITGLNFVDLSEGRKESACLETLGKDDIPEIKSIPSFLVRMEESFGSVSTNLMKTMHNVQMLLDEVNREQLSKALVHFANTMQRIERALDDRTIEHFQQLMASTSSAVQKLDTATIPKIDRFLNKSVAFEANLSRSIDSVSTSIQSVSKSYLTIAESAEVFRVRNANSDYSVKENVGPPMVQFELTMREMQQTLIGLNVILDKFSNSPSDILLQHEQPNIGPGEIE